MKALKKVAGQLKLEMAQYQELQAFMQFGSDLDAKTRHQLERGQRILELLKQGVHISRPVEIQIVLLWGVQNGIFDKVDLKEMPDYIRRVTEYFSNLKKDFLERLYSEKVLTDDLVAELKAIFEEWQKTQG